MPDIRDAVERGYERPLILQLFRFIDCMIRLPEGLEADFRQELYAYEEQQRMPYITTVEQAGIDKGVIIGEQRGVIIGEQRGEAKTLLRLLTSKFGPDCAERYRERVEAANIR
ncbi:transposase [Halochromatium roseum]|uniref:transposase n=1 Tax=Halochromatium roseum TaxID=391920 RepID=UPI00191325DD|nr:transposase [Halochromatium roseum]